MVATGKQSKVIKNTMMKWNSRMRGFIRDSGDGFFKKTGYKRYKHGVTQITTRMETNQRSGPVEYLQYQVKYSKKNETKKAGST